PRGHLKNLVGQGATNRNRPEATDLWVIKNGPPRSPAILAFPSSAANAAEIISVGIALNAADGNAASAAKRANHPPTQAAQVNCGCRCCSLLSGAGAGKQCKEKNRDQHSQSDSRSGGRHKRSIV